MTEPDKAVPVATPRTTDVAHMELTEPDKAMPVPVVRRAYLVAH